MSLVPPGASHFSSVNLYVSIQVAVTSAVLYDHALALGREVELIWKKPLSIVTVLYVIDRYLGDAVLMYVATFASFSRLRPPVCVIQSRPVFMLFGIFVRRGIQLFQFRAWGALIYSWATQATMQLRIYAMYRRSRRILILLLTMFFCEIAAISFIIWREIGPRSPLEAIKDSYSGQHFCAFSGVNRNFVYMFIPLLCFELGLFVLAARMFMDSIKRSRKVSDGTGLESPTFLRILARDSLCYFFINLIASAVVMGLWQTVTERYANICVPFVMLLEVLIGTRLILSFRERCARPDGDPVVSGRFSSLHFRRDSLQTDSIRLSIRYQVETNVMVEAGTPA